MFKNKLMQSTFKLIIYGFIAKVLSMVARVITNRLVKEEAMGIFSLVSPLMVLLITLAQMGLPTAVSKLVAHHKEERKKYLTFTFVFGISINLVFMVLLLLLAPLIATYVLKNESTLETLYMLAFLGPLVFISGLLKGYCIGINKIEITSKSQISEEVARILFILATSAFFVSKGSQYGAMLVMLGVVIGEIFQTLYLLYANARFIKPNVKELVKISTDVQSYPVKDVFMISFPLTGSRLISSIAYFLEPILLMNILLAQGLEASDIALEYGQLSAYALPLLFLPGFFANSFATVLLPNLTEAYTKHNLKRSRKVFAYFTGASFLVGLFFAFIYVFFAEPLSIAFYGSTFGAKYVSALAVPFSLYYIEAPIINAQYALSLNKKAFINTVSASIIRILSTLIFVPTMGVMGLGVAMTLSVTVIVIFGLNDVLKRLL